jgi:hypothetical protein
MVCQDADKGGAGEPVSLIGVHDFGFTVFQKGFFQRVNASVCRQAVRQAERQHPSRRPVQNHRQVNKASFHRNIGRIHRPHLIGAGDGPPAQQIRVNPVFLVPPAGIGFPVKGFYAHLLHQRADVPTPNFFTFQLEHAAQHSCAGKRMVQVQLVYASHQGKIFVRDPPGAVVHG